MGGVNACLLGVVAATFGYAGATKLLRPFPIALALTHFGLATRIRPRVGRTIGAAEGLIAVSLVATSSAVFAFFAAVISTGFAVLLGLALVQGKSFDCGCFGSQSSPVSRFSVLRSVGLASAAAVSGIVTVVSHPPTLNQRLLGFLAGSLILACLMMMVDLRRTRPFSTQLGGARLDG